MPSIAYFDCPTGIAGDMCLGALVSAGVPLTYLSEELAKLGLAKEYDLRSELVQRQGQQATKVHVQLLSDSTPTDRHHEHHHHAPHRHLPDIQALIQPAAIPSRAKDWSLAIFQQLAIAEGAVHGIAPQQVHFHEVGATDAIVDIVGTCLGLDYLGIERIFCSPLPTGGGTVWAEHGRLPVPVPAVVKLWESRQVPIYSNGIDRELVTPTGAAIAVTLAESFGQAPGMVLQKMGLGAGSQELSTPNILRLWLGDLTATSASECQQLGTQETIMVLETHCDDLNPQAIGYLFEQLLTVGALDVFTTAIGMKKSRPGILLTVLCYPSHLQPCQQILFQETTTLGIRISQQARTVLARQFHRVTTPYGEVSIKCAYDSQGNLVNLHPEFEDCATLARQSHQPWQVIYQAAIAATLHQPKFFQES